MTNTNKSSRQNVQAKTSGKFFMFQLQFLGFTSIFIVFVVNRNFLLAYAFYPMITDSYLMCIPSYVLYHLLGATKWSFSITYSILFKQTLVNSRVGEFLFTQ